MEIFRSIDFKNRGVITSADFRRLCLDLDIGLTAGQIVWIFDQLDTDQDGLINSDDFIRGHRAFTDLFIDGVKSETPPGDVTGMTSDGDGLARWKRFVETHEVELGILPSVSQEQICDMYQSLHDSGMQEQLSKFEGILLAVIKDVRVQQYENNKLEKSYQREKEQHAKHLQHLEEDAENQLQKVEHRVRTEERQKYSTLYDEWKAEKESEIDELQSNLRRLQTLETSTSQQDKPASDDVRDKLDELTEENRSLKRSLTDAQTSLALQRSEVTTVKAQWEEKCYELEKEKHALVEYMKEHENLTRQIHMLHDANKTLHDTNDDLREAMENARSFSKRPRSAGGRSQLSLHSLSTTGTRGEFVRRYLQQTAAATAASETGDETRDREEEGGGGPEVTSLAVELGMADDDESSRGLLPAQDSCEVDSLPEERDSGHFTIRDAVYDEDTDEDVSDATPLKDNRKSFIRNSTFRASAPCSATASQLNDSFDGSTTPLSSIPGSVTCRRGTTRRSLRGLKHAAHVDRTVTASGYVVGDEDLYSVAGTDSMACSRCSYVTGCDVSDSVSNIVAVTASPKTITHEAERIFKIVLAGDAAVGKSSFILRLCKNKFVANLNSTLGVDFQTKTLEVGGRVIALQLWDTAGQERFRSIAKSYFRRADGVLLLYDVTYERSFINVREWLEAIEEGAQKRLPVMLVGNKSDLRDEQTKCVKFEDGQRLARQFQGLFIETSAKDGSNVLEAVTELSRMLMANEDLEVQAIGLQLQDTTSTKKRSPCCK